MALFIALAMLFAIACTSSSASEDTTPTVPPPGSAPGLTAQEIIERANDASLSVDSFTAEGESILFGDDEGHMTIVMSAEWAAPDSMHRTVNFLSGDESQTQEIIRIGEYAYQRPWLHETRWKEISVQPDDAGGAPEELQVSLTPDGATEVVELDYLVAYKVTGVPDEQYLSLPPVITERSVRETLFIDASTFRLIRAERLVSVTYEEEGEELGYTEETWTDFSYPDVPPVIERPVDYIPAETPD